MEKEKDIEKKDDNLTPEQRACRERLKQFVFGYLKTSQRKFAEMAGLSPSYLPTFKGNVRGDSRIKLMLAYPNLNLDWLETGEGEMILYPIEGQCKNDSGERKKKSGEELVSREQLLAQIANLQAKLEEKEKLIMRQQESISNLIAMIGK